MNWWLVLLIGAGVGYVAGMFGKGGSAIATPLLHAAGVPAMVALTAPLPAAIPSTMAASVPYLRSHLVSRRVVTWSVAFGLPATIAGALLTRWIDGAALIRLTDLIVAALGVRTLLSASVGHLSAAVLDGRVRLALTAMFVGFVSGLLANSGGFLLVPLYLLILHLPIKGAFANSLIVSASLAVPGTLVHAALGHIDWTVVVVFGAASIPLSALGARTALRTDPARLERLYGAGLLLLGVTLFATG
jgi:uncharacterized membrane protein YfcA